MAKIFDLRNAGGQLILLGDALVLPSSNDSAEPNIAGSLRYNPDGDIVEVLYAASGVWQPFDTGATSATSSTVSASTTSVTLIAININRKAPGVVITNNGAGDLYVRLGSSAASIAAYDVMIEPGLSATIGPDHQGAIQGIWTVTGGSADITEYTT